VRQSEVSRNYGNVYLEALDVHLHLGISRAKGAEAMDFD